MTTASSGSLPPDSGDIALEISDGVASLLFSHPKGNSLPGALLRRLASTVTSLGGDSAARVIVLRSAGPGAFCAGASFDELQGISDAGTGREFFMGFAGLILAMIRCPKPIIARVHGKTVGGGVGLVAAADHAIATTGASVRLSELAVGIGPFVVGPAIERKIGTGAFAAMALDAEWRDAAWAERHGLYARVVEDSRALDEAVSGLARTLAGRNPEAVRDLKRVMWAGTEHWEELLRERAEMSGRLVLSAFTRNAIAAFAAR